MLKSIMSETFREDEYKDCEISLKKNKGAIIINHNLYIFETKNHINQRFNYEKINGQKKYEYLYKMKFKEFNFELSDEVWNILKLNLL
jgi:hypothetical protein